MATGLLLAALRLVALARAGAGAAQGPPSVLVGAHYFGGWARHNASSYSHYHGYRPRGQPTEDIFGADAYPERTPTLLAAGGSAGEWEQTEASTARELRAADSHGVAFFDVLYYDGGWDCGTSPTDPNLAYCLDSPVAWMLNSTSVWNGVQNLRFYLSYSNDIDARSPGKFVGVAGDENWRRLVATWAAAIAHPRYLRVNGRPVFKVLIPAVFLKTECEGNVSLATQRLGELRAAVKAGGSGELLLGGGWDNPSIAATGVAPSKRPHPRGFEVYSQTEINCPGGCQILSQAVGSLAACEALANATSLVTAFSIDADRSAAPPLHLNCTLFSKDGPGGPSTTREVFVRVLGEVAYDFTGSYNAAPPICRDQCACCECACAKYKNSWWPNSTAAGAKVFPYREMGDYQTQARTNHSSDTQPYLANVIAGFDPRPWQEHNAAFAPPTPIEWEAVLRAVKAQCLNASNRFGFPDASLPGGVQPAFEIYAWNEYGEGGLLAPTKGLGDSLIQGIAKVFKPSRSQTPDEGLASGEDKDFNMGKDSLVISVSDSDAPPDSGRMRMMLHQSDAPAVGAGGGAQELEVEG